MDGGMYGGMECAIPFQDRFDYQPRFINEIRGHMQLGYRRVAGESPTGSGKSYVALELARSVLGKGGEFRYIGPRKQLVKDVSRKMEDAGIQFSMHMSGVERPMGRLPNVQLWCMKSYINYIDHIKKGEKDLMPGETIQLRHVDLFVIDEAHINQKSILKIVLEFPKSRFIFLTATPLPGMDRYFIDGRPCLVHGPTVKELTERGVLVPARYKTFEPDNLEAEHLRGEIVSTWIREGEDRPTVVFCKNRREAKMIQQRFLAPPYGVAAEYMDALTSNEEREEIFERIRLGESKVLVNVKVMEYGVDKPFFSCAVLAYAVEAKLEDTLTKLAGYIQRAGRVLRASPGKTDALIIDLTGIVNMFRALDEERQWEIDGKKIKEMAEDERKAVKKEREDPKLITCHECGHQFMQLSMCPRCNAAVSAQASEDVQHIEATIAEVDLSTGRHIRRQPRTAPTLWTRESAHQTYAQILWCVRNKTKKDGTPYSDGMAWHVYNKLKTGIDSPHSKSVRPVMPDQSMREWVDKAIRSQNALFFIRNRKGRAPLGVEARGPA